VIFAALMFELVFGNRLSIFVPTRFFTFQFDRPYRGSLKIPIITIYIFFIFAYLYIKSGL